jgi:hypothetical protein
MKKQFGRATNVSARRGRGSHLWDWAVRYVLRSEPNGINHCRLGPWYASVNQNQALRWVHFPMGRVVYFDVLVRLDSIRNRDNNLVVPPQWSRLLVEFGAKSQIFRVCLSKSRLLHVHGAHPKSVWPACRNPLAGTSKTCLATCGLAIGKKTHQY